MVQREQYTLEKSLKIALMVMSCPRSHRKSVFKSPRQGAKEHTHLRRNVERKKGPGRSVDSCQVGAIGQKLLILRYQTLYLPSPPASLQGNCSGMFLWSLFLHPTVKRKQGCLFSIPPVEIFLKGKNDQCSHLGKDFLLRVTDLALTKQVYVMKEREILSKKKGI